MSQPSSTSASWTPNTTNQLNWGPLFYDVLDHFLAHGGEDARLDVLNSPLLSSLRPARTTGEVELQTVMARLGSNDFELQNIRGDLSTFLSPGMRASQSFQTQYPNFSTLLKTMEATVRTNALRINSFPKISSKVSVQLSLFPGDGKSGYPEHCDVTGLCCKDEGDDGSSVNNQQHQRILTAIYYLTPSDWSPEVDGGHLRLSVAGTNFAAAPLFNRLILFRSDKVLHQVLPSKRRDRIAVTMWFYRMQSKHDQNFLPLINPITPLLLKSTAEAASEPPPLRIVGKADSTSTIFVSIASFRDTETLPTIRALLNSAQFPNRITVGLVWQYDPEIDPPMPVPTSSQVRCLTIQAKDARGPCYARRLAQLLYKEEDYVLQIDSHMRFRRNWDLYLIEQLPAGLAMLTTYPVGYTLPNNIPSEIRPTLLVPWKFDSAGMLRQRGRLLRECTYNAPIRTQLFAAGFNFARGQSIQDCPYLTHQVFFGEEVFRAVQLHQKNYQLWAPPETVVYHLWSRDHRPVFSTGEAREDQQALKNHLDQNVSKAIWTAMGIDWTNKELLQDACLGGMPSEDSFAGWVDDDFGTCVDQLDSKAKDIIRSFLPQVELNH